jgi:glutamyl-tRNA synthetase
MAQERARAAGGTLVLRNEDIDSTRYQMEFVAAMLEDLKWFGFEWQEGPDIGGPFGPYNQSERGGHYLGALERLIAGGFVYPCVCSRSDVRAAARAPHAADDDEPIYGGTCRPKLGIRCEVSGVRPASATPPVDTSHLTSTTSHLTPGTRFSWRFRVPDGETIAFVDGNSGPQSFVAGRNFGDFVVWRPDGVPAYQLAVVVDDALMQITEVVRGEDLLCSTARQLLLYRALNWPAPAFFHCPLLCDASGVRLAKRHDAMSLRQLRVAVRLPGELRASW